MLRPEAKAHELRHVHAVVREENVLLERVDLDAGVVINSRTGDVEALRTEVEQRLVALLSTSAPPGQMRHPFLPVVVTPANQTADPRPWVTTETGWCRCRDDPRGRLTVCTGPG